MPKSIRQVDRNSTLASDQSAGSQAEGADAASFPGNNPAPAPDDGLRPLVVDLDGTLIPGDLLIESFLGLVAHNPLSALAALPALLDGKAALKARIADQIPLDASSLPINAAVLELITERRARGGKVVLASASDERYVAALAEHLGLFDEAIGSTPDDNLSGHRKAAALIERFGTNGFDYVGNDTVDLAIWRHANTAYIVSGKSSLEGRLRRAHTDVIAVPSMAGGLRAYIRAMRPHQWLKNILILVPAAANHSLGLHFVAAVLAFLAFSLCASSVYITNDLLDLPGDRDHATKRRRPFASGAASPAIGIGLAVVLLLASVAVACAISLHFLFALAGYYALTTAYSLYLKRQPIVDVIALACLYGMRIIAGGIATGIVLSPWLEAMSVFLFLSLALTKRSSEIIGRIDARKGEIVGRGYRLADLAVLESMAAAAGYNAVLVLALYVNSAPERLAYAHPHRLLFLCLLLLSWISYILLVTRRGKMNSDPVIFAFRDRWSLAIGACSGLVVLAASF